MSTTAPPGHLLQGSFARELPELAVPWQAAEAPDPTLLLLNEPLARELGLDPEHLRTAEGTGMLVGTRPPAGATPVAMAYAGHQFGSYVPRLGDGRALLLGERTDQHGRRRDLHLKGSGPTPFARGGDGLAAVGPMLREYVVSEALHALGVPTTRSLAVVATGAAVRRETLLPGAVLARVASSHLRVGTFQYARATGDLDLLRRLADHAIARHHPGAAEAANPALALLEGVVDAQASLVAQWMLLGFVHGVMNTDNTTISGESIDYGPCAFMEAFDPATVFSSIDVRGRYAYGNQPVIAQWNLARLAEALLPLVHPDPDEAVTVLTEVVNGFQTRYSAAWKAGLRRKLGLPDDGDDAASESVVLGWTPLLIAARADHTSAFRALTAAGRGDTQPVRELFADVADFPGWLEQWQALAPDVATMERTNPVYIPRNHLVEEALDAATAGDLTAVEQLLDVVTQPFTERPGLERYAQPAPPDTTFVTYCGT